MAVETTRAGVVADVHLGNHKRFGGETVGSINVRCRLALDVFKRAVAAAKAASCTHFVVAGDLFDYARPEPALLAAAQEIIEDVAEQMGVYLMIGNHDRTSGVYNDNALAPLRPYATIVDKPLRVVGEDGAELLLVPYQPGPVVEWLQPAVSALISERDASDDSRARLGGTTADTLSQLLVLHMGIRDDATPPWLRDAPGAVNVEALRRMCEDLDIDHVMAGDWHEHKVWKSTGMPGHRPYMMQLGALVPTGWDNPGVVGYGTFATWEQRLHREGGPRVKRIEIPGPRFVKVSTSADRDAAVESGMKDNTLFVSEVCAPEDLAERTMMANLMTAGLKEIGGYEVLPDQTIAKADARMAASLARNAETFDAALEGFVAAMPLGEHINRGAVHERCKEFLK